MLRTVIDTSSLVSYVLTRGEIMQKVIARWRANRFVLLSSPQIHTELVAVLARPYIRRRIAVSPERLIYGLERYTWQVPGKLDLVGSCRDSKDDKFLACAIEGRAHYLVSSDKDLLDMRMFRNCAIVNPGQFLLAVELYELNVESLVKRFEHDVLTSIQETMPLEPMTSSRVNQALTMLSDRPV